MLLLLLGAATLPAGSKTYRDTLSVDGPYILYTADGVRVITVDKRGRITDRTAPEAPERFTVADHKGKNAFQVSLHKFSRQDWQYRSKPARTFVMSDPHGRLDCVVSLLQGNGVIDSGLHWSYGQDHLVVIGDIFDRGEDAVQIYWLFYKLQEEAADAGGRVTMLLGNHEPMEFAGDMRYAKPKYKVLSRKLGMEYRDLFGPDSELGRWIATWNVIAVVGSDLFVHAGLGGDFYRRDIPVPEVNRQMSSVLFNRNSERKAASEQLAFLYGRNGPVWYRGLVLPDEKWNPVQPDTLQMILDRAGVDHIIVGHTMLDDVCTFYDGKVIDVNVDNPGNMKKGLGRALLIDSEGYSVVGDKGFIRRLEEPSDIWASLRRRAAAEYLKPVRPFTEGRNPCWNGFAKKFMYAPVFDFKPVEGAESYVYTITDQDGGSVSFTAATPTAPLSEVWNDIAPGHVTLTVCTDAGDTAGVRSFIRDYPYDGPYNGPVRDYRDAAIKGALYAHCMPEIQNWRKGPEPDMSYHHNTYPCKIIGATIRNECFIARELPSRREEALEIARSAAAFLIAQSRPEGDPLAYFPPTYYQDLEASKRDWNKGKTMTMEAAAAGQAFLDLYDVTGEKEYFERALNIGRTYVRLQREDGSLPIKVDFVTGEPVNGVSAMLHPLLRYFRRLQGFGVTEFDEAQLKGERWMDEVAVETFDMTGQFEDVNVNGLQPYQNLTNCTAAPYASYLLTKQAVSDKNLSDAIDLIRLSEDQFLHWAYPDKGGDGFVIYNAPCVHEQYHYEMPVDHSACNVANALLDLYERTGDLLALAKAKALVDNITIQQNAVNGKIPTTWQWRDSAKDRNRTWWMNCSFGSITTLMRMDGMKADLEKLR